jgi:preprotein translocase subunit SecY
MAIRNNDAWYISAIGGGLALLVFSPVMFNIVEGAFSSVGLGGTVAILEGRDGSKIFGLPRPTVTGVLLHSVVLFFLLYMILALVDFQCD